MKQMENQETETKPEPKPINVLILAAGLGTRMRSETAKVLHELGGRPLVAHVCRTARTLEPARIIVVVGHQADLVEAAVRTELGDSKVGFAVQTEQHGTGDAVMAARAELADSDSTLLVLSGDVPLVRAESLAGLVQQHRKQGKDAVCTILTVELEDPTGYGRMIRDTDGKFVKIVEHRDATDHERKTKEINSGIYCFDTQRMFAALERVQPVNAQGEYYLTDVPNILRQDGSEVGLHLHEDAREVSGINNRVELAEFESILRRRTLRRLMLESGVTFIDPLHTYVGEDARIGRDTVIYPNVHIEGTSVVGERCVIRAGARLTNATIGDGVTIKDHSMILDSWVGDGCSVGPFAHLRMQSVLMAGAAVGNFVELKKSTLGPKSKAMHLTYLGDATIGTRTNIGAGTITCNYDGKNKHPTTIGDGVKIGSDTMLVAPVTVGNGAVTAAGSVVTRDIEPNTLVAGVPALVKKKLESDEK
ncbi:MAG: bifunctional UDP-N-acetylglucosamine diphosphorylase/glucosamine-1-phosphate N-acetyltransferase GlmU [Pyrinomonadaceae bacterium]